MRIGLYMRLCVPATGTFEQIIVENIEGELLKVLGILLLRMSGFSYQSSVCFNGAEDYVQNFFLLTLKGNRKVKSPTFLKYCINILTSARPHSFTVIV
jgi:hypothetical protein